MLVNAVERERITLEDRHAFLTAPMPLSPASRDDAVSLAVESVSALRRRHREREAAGGLRYVWQDILPNSGVLFGHIGHPKVGKTTFGFVLARTAGRGGGEMLGRKVQGCRVLVLALEDPPFFTEALVSEHFADGDDVLIFTDRLKADPAGLARIVATIEAREVGLVIISSLSVFWAVEDENDNAKVQRAGELIRDAARASGVPWLVDIHSRKTEGSDGAQIRGASSLAGVIDGWISQTRGARKIGERDTRRHFEVRGRLPHGGLDIAADFDRQTGTYNITEAKRGSVDSALAERCMSIAEKHGGKIAFTALLTALDLADGSKYRAAVERALLATGWQLVKEGRGAVWVAP